MISGGAYLDTIVTQVPLKERIFVLIGAYAPIGKRGEGAGGKGSKVPGPYGWDVTHGNGFAITDDRGRQHTLNREYKFQHPAQWRIAHVSGRFRTAQQ